MAKKRVEISDDDLIDRIQKEADRDKRSFTAQLAVLAGEALDRREAKERG